MLMNISRVNVKIIKYNQISKYVKMKHEWHSYFIVAISLLHIPRQQSRVCTLSNVKFCKKDCDDRIR